MIFKFVKYQLLTLLLMLSGLSYAQNEIDYNQLKLSKAIEIGLQNNKKLQISALKTNIAELKEKDLKNEKLPDVDFHTGFE